MPTLRDIVDNPLTQPGFVSSIQAGGPGSGRRPTGVSKKFNLANNGTTEELMPEIMKNNGYSLSNSSRDADTYSHPDGHSATHTHNLLTQSLSVKAKGGNASSHLQKVKSSLANDGLLR